MNNVLLIGRLVKDVESKFTEEGKSISRLTLAVNRMKKDEADFISCTAFGKTAEVLINYTQKGSQIAIQGNIRTGSYEKDGTKVYTTEVVIQRVELLSGKGLDNKVDKVDDMVQDFSDTPF